MLKAMLTVSALFISSAFAAPLVAVSQIKQMPLSTEFRASAQVISVQEVELSTELEGKLEWVAQVGTLAEKGQLIARLNDAEDKLLLQTQEARVAQLTSLVFFAKRELSRVEKLAKDNSASAQKLDDAKRGLSDLEFGLKKAQLEQQRLALELSRTQILAPFNGQVVQRSKVGGSFVERGERILTLVDIQSKEISAKLPVSDSAKVDLQTTQVQIELMDQASVEGKIRAMVQVGDELSRMVEVRIEATELATPIGMPVEVVFSTAQHTMAWQIPRDALVNREQAIFVYQIDADNKANKIVVTVVNDAHQEYVLVEGELSPNLAIVIRGAEMLADQQVVDLDPS